jgi:hypothetical protein
MKRVLITMAVILAIFANINLHAAIEPCTGTHLTGCDWSSVQYKELSFSDCPQCKVIVEYYTKECDGNFAIQITAVYRVKIEPGLANMQCYTYLGDLQDRVHNCYKQLLEYYHSILENPNQTYFMQQKSCSKTYGYGFTDFGTIEIPVIAFVDRNLVTYPVDPTNPSMVAVHIMSGWEVCESTCCCYQVEAHWDNLSGNLLTMYVDTPCGINEDYECPTGCTGGCEDMQFSWTFLYGFNDPDAKIAINTNEFESQISIIPNPNKGSFKISYSDETKGNLTIKLTDINGNILQTYNFNKKTGEFSNDFVINENNGTYILLFELNGNYLGSSKIMINK